MLHGVIWYNSAHILEVLAASIDRVMVNYQITHHNIPEDSLIHTCRHENLRARQVFIIIIIIITCFAGTEISCFGYKTNCNMQLISGIRKTGLMFKSLW